MFDTTTLLLLAFTLLLTLTYRTLQPSFKFPAASPKLTSISSFPILGATKFFTARWQFFRHARDQSPTGNFSFFLGKHPVVGLTGVEGRKTFFESRELGFGEGGQTRLIGGRYAVLFGQSPNALSESNVAIQDKDFAAPGGYFQKRITKMLRTENFGKSLPHLMKDVRASMDKLAQDPKGITDPFESLYRVVFQLTMRIVGCDDIAEDPVLLEKTLKLYETVEASTNATTILFPWLPTISSIKRTVAGGRIYMIFNKIVNDRKKNGTRRDDPLQFLMDQADSMERIIEFVVGALFAGLLNSGVNVAWVLTYLSTSPYWLSKIRSEITSAASKHCPDSSLPLIDQLTHIPVEAWESEFPNLDLCLKDSIRLQMPGTAFRKNISGRDIPSGTPGEVIPADAFVAYALGDISLNPEVYTDPETWDPSRYLPGREEDKKVPHAYIGWGSGRHPCLGMRFAKLEQNIITAFFLAMFDFELTDSKGVRMAEPPKPDFDAHSAEKPKVRPFLKYKLR
ncbi:Sterol 14-demethylase [Lachnellula suecica]|uniref:Sterol 14-demethylase n=1 Tax=Lachnellula suecica TaxID=602035 RepID=A0A8T9C0K7_9HELO|nr:Sterol 14-demethylase [Lachnellula suecica]